MARPLLSGRAARLSMQLRSMFQSPDTRPLRPTISGYGLQKPQRASSTFRNSTLENTKAL